ncbi:MAG: YceD family protein [Candidatus Gallimonas sp.]
MMIPTIDVRKLNARKQYEGEAEFAFEADDSLIDIPYVRFSSPVGVRLRYVILEDDSVEVTGSVKFSLKGACSRCLTETEQTFTGEIDAYFTPRGEGEDYRYTNGVIRLEDCLNDAVMLAIPGRLECGENCVPFVWKEE